MTTRALVYGDVDLNLLDGSAIWLQSVTQALAWWPPGAPSALVLKAPVRTDRLIAPLRDVADVANPRTPAARGEPAAGADPSVTALTVPQAITKVLASHRQRFTGTTWWCSAGPGAGLGGGPRTARSTGGSGRT